MSYQQMKYVIKTIIALAIILGSYFIGFYQASENCNAKTSILNNRIKVKEKDLKELQDNLTLLKKQLIECSSKRDDTLKIQIIDSLIKRTRK